MKLAASLHETCESRSKGVPILWVPRYPIQDLQLGFCRGPPEGEDGPWHRPSCVWLSVAFVRMLQQCRLRRAERDELAIEVVMFGQRSWSSVVR